MPLSLRSDWFKSASRERDLAQPSEHHFESLPELIKEIIKSIKHPKSFIVINDKGKMIFIMIKTILFLNSPSFCASLYSFLKKNQFLRFSKPCSPTGNSSGV